MAFNKFAADAVVVVMDVIDVTVSDWYDAITVVVADEMI